MARKPEPSFEVKQIIWDIAAVVGRNKIAEIERQLDKELEKLRKDEFLHEGTSDRRTIQKIINEDTPDRRTIQKIINQIDTLEPDVVIAKLPPHVWHLRYDYEKIKHLADKMKAQPPMAQTFIFQSPYEDTAHKKKMRELADIIAHTHFPIEHNNFIDKRVPGEYFIGHGFKIMINESGEVEPVFGHIHEQHLYNGLFSHLETGGFGEIVETFNEWKCYSGEALLLYQELHNMVIQHVAKRFNCSLSLDSFEAPGFTIDFVDSICWGAYYQQDISTAKQYRKKGCSLLWTALRIYNGSPGEDLNTYIDLHLQLTAEFRETDVAKKMRELCDEIRDDEDIKFRQLHKFIDMERLPGHCELCEVSDKESRNNL